MGKQSTLSFVVCFGLGLGALTGGTASFAQVADPPPDLAALSQGIDRLDRSLDDIARSLRQLLDRQRIEIVIRRIELEERRLAPLGNELRGARGEVRAQREEIARLTGYLDTLREQIDQAVRAGADPLSVPERGELDHVQGMIELQQEQIEAAERRVVELENDVARGRDRITILDERLQELLEDSGD